MKGRKSAAASKQTKAAGARGNPESRVAPAERRAALSEPKQAKPKRRTSTHRRPPYISCLERRGSLSLWLVNGSWVRKNTDEEYSNFAHHWSIGEIPKNEIWIDQETDPDEQRFFVHHALVERALMVAGKDYDTARRAANAEERRMRVAAGDLKKVIKGKALPDATKVHREVWKTLPSGVQVWFVKGRLVRSVYDIEFTEGGHEHVYEYVPRGEVWIDDDIHEDERGFVLFHELHERNLMSQGMDYDTAHDESSKLEKHYRKHPDQLHEALAAEGWE